LFGETAAEPAFKVLKVLTDQDCEYRINAWELLPRNAFDSPHRGELSNFGREGIKLLAISRWHGPDCLNFRNGGAPKSLNLRDQVSPCLRFQSAQPLDVAHRGEKDGAGFIGCWDLR
jgi:hypothetical protein